MRLFCVAARFAGRGGRRCQLVWHEPATREWQGRLLGGTEAQLPNARLQASAAFGVWPATRRSASRGVQEGVFQQVSVHTACLNDYRLTAAGSRRHCVGVMWWGEGRVSKLTNPFCSA